MLWAIVSLREPTEDVLPARIVPLLGAGMSVRDELPEVRVLVRGVGRDILKLHRTPPVIRRRIPTGASGDVTLELAPANVTLPPDVDVTVEEVLPRTITLRLRRADAAASTEAAAPTPTPRRDSAALPPRDSARPDSARAAVDGAPARERGDSTTPRPPAPSGPRLQ